MKRLKKISIIVASVFVALTIIAFAVFQMPAFGGTIEGARLAKIKRLPQFMDGRLENNPRQNTDNSLIKNIQQYQGGQIRHPKFEIPVMKIENLNQPPQPGLRAYWFGHASVLIEIEGVRIMTDPVLSDYASPFAFGPKRFHPPPVSLDEIQGIDAVVISHDHYDHLDMHTICKLAQQGTHFFVGIGIGAHLERWNVPANQIHEMEWWQPLEFKGINVVCTPARHYSGRKKMDNSTLWASWFVKGKKHSFYFSGDTGYSPHFKEIKNGFGEPDVAMIKVGAYGKTWLDIHMDPESAVQAAMDLGAKVMLPVHWATFNLAYHDWEEPIYRTLNAAKENNVSVITPRIGEKFEYGQPFNSVSWFEAQRK